MYYGGQDAGISPVASGGGGTTPYSAGGVLSGSKVVGGVGVEKIPSKTLTTTVTFIKNPKDLYRFGFDGQEKVNEISLRGTHYDFGARYYDARTGRWFGRDKYERDYPSMSPYSSFGNNPIYNIDVNGDRLFIAGSNSANARTAIQDMYTHAGQYGKKLFSVVPVGNNAYEVKTSLFTKQIAALYNDPGVMNLYEMIRASETMEYRVAEEVVPGGINYPNGSAYKSSEQISKAAKIHPEDFKLITDPKSHGISNLSKTIYSNFDNYGVPPNGLDGQLVVLPSYYQYGNRLGGIKSRAAVVFHEFIEMFNRTVLKQSYYGDGGKAKDFRSNSAHRNAIFLENLLPIGDKRRDLGSEGIGAEKAPVNTNNLRFNSITGKME